MKHLLRTTTLMGSFALAMMAVDARAQPLAGTTGSGVTATEVVHALEGTYGVHPGERRNHAKGTCALGTFVGSPDASPYSRSLLFSGSEMPVVARFSLGGGDPNASDAARGVRGMALEFRLPNGGLQHMTMIDAPMFFAAMPRTFFDNLLALTPDPLTGKPDPEAMKAFAATHPESAGFSMFLADHNPPASYATSAYYSVHTFKFVNRDGAVTLVRWRFVPQDGEMALSDAEMATKPADFLEQALIDRARRGPVRWNMVIAIGQPGDPENDPTLVWPKDRKELTVGTLTISSATPQAGGGCMNINYDPLVMGEGIAPTNDPILLFRSPSYGVSYSERLEGK